MQGFAAPSFAARFDVPFACLASCHSSGIQFAIVLDRSARKDAPLSPQSLTHLPVQAIRTRVPRWHTFVIERRHQQSDFLVLLPRARASAREGQ